MDRVYFRNVTRFALLYLMDEMEKDGKKVNAAWLVKAAGKDGSGQTGALPPPYVAQVRECIAWLEGQGVLIHD